MSLWDTLPLEIADLIMDLANHLKPVIDELKIFHKERTRIYEVDLYRGIELKCVKNTVHAQEIQCKGGQYPGGVLYHKELHFLKLDLDTRRWRYQGDGVVGVRWSRGKNMKNALIAHVKKYVSEYETLRKSKKFPKIEKCSSKQLAHLLITCE